MSGQISDKDLDGIYAFAIQLGKDAGKMLMDGATLRMSSSPGQGEQKFEEKDNAVDIVTKTDTGMPDLLIELIEECCVVLCCVVG